MTQDQTLGAHPSHADTTAPKAARSADLFRHITAERNAQYRAIMETFASAKRQFRLHLRPDEVRAEAPWPGTTPPIEEVQQMLTQLVDWGNLQSQPDTARVQTLEDFYRARFLYRLTAGGEAVETAMTAFEQALRRSGELQSVALEDILSRLTALKALIQAETLDVPKVHEVLRDLVHVFEGLANNAQAFMTGLARSIELQRAEAHELMAYKNRLIGYLERFIADLVSRSGSIAEALLDLTPNMESLLHAAAAREARDAAPADTPAEADALAKRLTAWRERWHGLRGWFLSDEHSPAQAELLRARARAAIPQLLSAVMALNERRAGRSDVARDLRLAAQWFAECETDADAHRLFRALFALSPARHLGLLTDDDRAGAATSWRDARPVAIHPRLRERGTLAMRGAPPKIRDRSSERMELAARLAEEHAQMDAARRLLATGRPRRFSELPRLDRHAFRLFLSLFGEALAAQSRSGDSVTRVSADGLFEVRLEALGVECRATIETELGSFSGRDHMITITSAGNE